MAVLRRTLPILGLFVASGALAQISQSQGRWKDDWGNLAQHKAPEWLLDAKFGVQYVGPQLDLDDYQAWHWGRSAQRHRDIGSPAPDPHVEAFLARFAIVGKLPYVWVHKPLYAIHWGWLPEGFALPGVRPRAGAKVRMLGVDQDLNWRISGDRLLVDAPAARPAGNYAYAIRIPVGN